MADPFVSLLMSVWNPRRDWLREAVDSALSERGCELELIVVDDGSDLPVAGMLEDVEDSRLRTVRIPHGGLSAGRNAGIEAARGTHFRFIDGDDVLAPGSTARLLELAGDAGDAIVYGAAVYCDPELQPLGTLSSSREGSVAVECLLGRFPVMVPAMLVPRSVAERVGEFDTRIAVCEDWDYALRCLEVARVLGTSDTVLYYRRHENSNSARATEAWDGTQRVVRGYFERHPEQRGTRVERAARAMLDFMQARAGGGRRMLSSRYFWRAVANDPTLLVRGSADILRRRRRRAAIARLTPPS